MGVQLAVRKGLAALLIAVPLWAGCGDDSEQTAPADEPNVGPGVGAGAGKAEKGPSKSSGAGSSKTTTAKEKSEPSK